ncbi:MAG: hypothetical protein JXK94_14980, partial [Deltaproteobacteria bacterium]|nr:hypothetical protein [Deltaproteobacteria bacterium]
MFPDPLRPKLYLDYIFLFSLCFPLGLSFLFSPNESYYAQAASVGMLELFCVCLFFFLKEGDDSVTIEKKWKIVVLFWMVW